jgi:cyclopropane-fatty-acyl-phospholipid synthase
MISRIYKGHVGHARLEPVQHAFRYPVYFYAFDLAELPAMNRLGPLIGYNRFAPVSIRDADYLDRSEGSIRDKLMRFLASKGCDDGITRIELITAARFFNYVFNPVSFYYCYRADGSLRCTVAEVNNTFNERHVYILDEMTQQHPGDPATSSAAKEFHVSPFNDMEGTYQFSFSNDPAALDIRINIAREGRVVFRSQLSGKPAPLTAWNLLRMIVAYPLGTWLTVPRILWQSAKLFFGKKLRIYTKPVPRSDLTMQKSPTWLQRASMKIVLPYLEKMTTGHIAIHMPDRSVRHFGQIGSEPDVSINVRDYNFFWRALMDGEIGFGESYMFGEWETDDLPALLQLFIKNSHVFEDRTLVSSYIGRFVNRMMHLRRPNTLHGSRKNIEDHYDLSNDFFRLFLDPTMMYSCAIYDQQPQSLEDAQKNKLHTLIRKARIQKNDHVLEIGSGWGAFAIEAVRQTGCRVTTITVSQKQLELARQRVEEAGLQDSISVELCDYRHIQGHYDKIVSIEMLEAVGHDFLGDFFAVCDRVLKPYGLIVLQVITIPDARYDAYRNSVDWIQKHIFPGGHLPSLNALADAMAGHSRFVVENLENIGVHYARTLREWREKFASSADDVKRLGFDETFIRKWRYYLAYCEAAFATRYLNDLHLVLTRPNNPTLDGELLGS